MKKVTRIIAAVLSLMMLTCAFVSCGEEDTANYEKIFVYRMEPGDDPMRMLSERYVNITNDEELLAAINYLQNNHPSDVMGRKDYGKSLRMHIYFNDGIHAQLEVKTEEFRDYTKNNFYRIKWREKDDGSREYYVSLQLWEHEDDEYYAEWLKLLSENEKIKKVRIFYLYSVPVPG
ncbi:MAG: hypothetical protein IJW21_00230 [Clostridia bacterium]|nr:hypothetical protein [Clostridia bacterium]